MSVVAETALQFGINELLKVVLGQTIQTARIKTLVKGLEKTLKVIEPMLRESSRLSRVLDRPENETKMFIFHLERGKELVVKCSRIKFWNVYQKFVYSNKIIRLNNELLMFFKIDLPAIMMSTGMRSLVGIYDLADKMDQVLSVATHVRANRRLRGVPEVREHIVGFNWHLVELKLRLRENGTRVLVVSGPAGCGNTTLVKLLCHDNQIKGTYSRLFLY
ncbi:putative powdery mildew resistance protein, RPW8 [Helianthus annuus]|nr:putative powdery mildew resistance protein, RPW8 [Helianthus annuus]